MSLKMQLATAVAMMASLVLATQAAIAGTGDDNREIANYVMTESGLAKFTKAARNLYAVPGACAKEEDDGSSSQSIDQMVAKLNAVPGAQSAIQSAGMTTREYVVFMWSMLHNGMAAWAASQPGGKLPAGTLPANVDFYKKHEAQIAAIGANDPCDKESGGEDQTEE